MQKSKSGITIITLIITIVVILILTATFVATGLKPLDEARIAEIESEKKAIEEAAMQRYSSYLKNDKTPSSQFIGQSPTTRWSSASECAEAAIATVDFKEYEENDKIKKKAKISADIERDYDKYVKVVSKREALSLGVEQFSDDDVFILNYCTATAYGPIEAE